MNNERFKDKMKQLEQERDAIVEQLDQEGKQEYQQKKEGLDQQQDLNSPAEPGLLPG